MKKLFVLLILLLSFGRSQAADIEARTGILGGDGWGLQTGAYINFPQSRLFSIQTGLLLHTAGNSFSYGDDWNIDFFVPVYASFHIPLSDKVNLRLNAGAYTGSGEYWNLGEAISAYRRAGSSYGCLCLYRCGGQTGCDPCGRHTVRWR